jgi:hypothetical protein
MVSDVCQVQHLKLELADGYITIINTILTPYAPHLSSLENRKGGASYVFRHAS